MVTLEPMQNEVDGSDRSGVHRRSLPAGRRRRRRPTSVDADEPPEALRDGVVDLGAVATEFLLLGIDPYPRKPGAVFDAPPAGDPARHPFAALAALKKGDAENDR